MYFSVRYDDTNYFASPDDLERTYGAVTKSGPVSLAIPFVAGSSPGIPKAYCERWSVHPLNENKALVKYLLRGIADGRYEAMLHGYHHDEEGMQREFLSGSDLGRKVQEGKRYLDKLLRTKIRVFVPTHNAIGREGLHAIAREGPHLGGVAGLRAGWSISSRTIWIRWLRLRKWRASRGVGVLWVLDLGNHRELAGNTATPTASLRRNELGFRM
jgi:hypothetical protein